MTSNAKFKADWAVLPRQLLDIFTEKIGDLDSFLEKSAPFGQYLSEKGPSYFIVEDYVLTYGVYQDELGKYRIKLISISRSAKLWVEIQLLKLLPAAQQLLKDKSQEEINEFSLAAGQALTDWLWKVLTGS